MQFVKAQKTQRKLRFAILGPAGSGKTMSSLLIARGVVGPSGRIALIDTENYSASLYANVVDFDVLALDSFAPGEYVKAIQVAEDAGYHAIIIDSLSHAWSGKDGALERVDRAAGRSAGGNFGAWREVTPQHNAMVEAMTRCQCHLLVTMRTKSEYVPEKDEKTGKTTVKKLGMQPIQRDGLEYEFDVVGDMSLDNVFTVSKTRCSLLNRAVIEKPDGTVGTRLVAWLNDGAPAPAPAAKPATPAPGKTIKMQAFELIAEWTGLGFGSDAHKAAATHLLRAAGLPETLDDLGAANLLQFITANRHRPFKDVVNPPAKPISGGESAPQPPAEKATPPASSPAAGGGAAAAGKSMAVTLANPARLIVNGSKELKKGGEGKRAWTWYEVSTSAGTFATFSHSVHKLANEQTGRFVMATWKDDKRGRTIEAIELIHDEQTIEPDPEANAPEPDTDTGPLTDGDIDAAFSQGGGEA